MSLGPHPPKSGVDVGDHPPITPMRSATESELGGGDSWRLYEYVTRHFLGSVSPDCKYTRWGEPFLLMVSCCNQSSFKCFFCWRKTYLILICFISFVRTKVTFAAGGEKFSASGRTVTSAGFTAVMPWLAVADESLPPISAGESIPMTDVELYQVGVSLILMLWFSARTAIIWYCGFWGFLQ